MIPETLYYFISLGNNAELILCGGLGGHGYELELTNNYDYMMSECKNAVQRYRHTEFYAIDAKQMKIDGLGIRQVGNGRWVVDYIPGRYIKDCKIAYGVREFKKLFNHLKEKSGETQLKP